jgi:hypothetical protein
MSSTSETGHAKNVANFDKLIIYCESIGETYNPSNENIKLAWLKQVYQNSSQALENLKISEANLGLATSEREELFSTLSKLSTRILNSIKSLGPSVEITKSAQTVNRKIQGQRAKAIEAGATNSISVSQQSYTSKANNFAKLLELLRHEPFYKPNEEELKVTTLQKYLDTLNKANFDVANATIDCNNTLISRDKALYGEDSGLVKTGKLVKIYLKSLFGASSPDYKEVSGIKFISFKTN